jgi:hypothetical protein
MFPLQIIIDCLLTGATRLPMDQRTEVLCTMFAALLPQMTDADVAATREQVVNRLWPWVDVVDPLLHLIDGHVELRTLLHALANEDMLENYGETTE